jgi:23S rRNA pseudouridine2605 synthase
MRGKDDQSTAGERIAKVIARAGLASRREAEAWIAAGRVAVNGEVIATPARNVTAADRIAVDGEPLPARERTRLFLYHKPRGLLTTHVDPGGRPTIFSGLPAGLPRLVSVGRLDLNTEGLLLLTNDGGLARVLELPATGWLRRYRVRAHGRVEQEQLDRLRQGITIDGVRYGSIEATVDRTQGANVWLTFAIREGKNREVKNVLGHLGLAVNRLIRVSFGPFQLGEIAEGGIEEVRTRTLREQLGERVAALAGADFSGPRIEREPPKPSMPPRHAEQRADKGARERKHPPPNRKRRRPDDRIGEPERARREKRRGRKLPRGKPG